MLSHLVGDVEVEVGRIRPRHCSDGKRLAALRAPDADTVNINAKHVGGALALQQPAQSNPSHGNKRVVLSSCTMTAGHIAMRCSEHTGA